MRHITVVSSEGEVIAFVSPEEKNRLLGRNEDGSAPRIGEPEYPHFPNGAPIYNTQFIRLHKKYNHVYVAIVEPSTIKAELRKDVFNRLPVAEDCITVTKEPVNGPVKSGWVFAFNFRRSFAYHPDGEDGMGRIRAPRTVEKVVTLPEKRYRFPLRDEEPPTPPAAAAPIPPSIAAA